MVEEQDDVAGDHRPESNMHPFSNQEAEDQIPANASLGDLTESSGNGYARQSVPANAVGMVSAARHGA